MLSVCSFCVFFTLFVSLLSCIVVCAFGRARSCLLLVCVLVCCVCSFACLIGRLFCCVVLLPVYVFVCFVWAFVFRCLAPVVCLFVWLVGSLCCLCCCCLFVCVRVFCLVFLIA